MRLTINKVELICEKYFGKENVIQIYKMDDKPYWSIALKDRCCQLSRDELLNMNKKLGYVVRT